MNVHRSFVTPQKPLPFDEDVDFSSFDLKRAYPLLSLKKVHAKGEFHSEDGVIYATLEISAIATLSDSRTCEPFDYPLDYEDEFALLSEMEEDAEGYLFEENVIELRDVVYCSLHSHIPMCPHKSGADLPSSGEGYTVYSEDEAEERKAPSPFDVLKDYQTED